LRDSRANAFRNVYDTLQIAFYECEYVVVQDGERVVRLVETRRGCQRCIEGVILRRVGRERCVGRPRSVRCSGLVAYWEWRLRDEWGMKGVERAREDGLQNSR
jgi:hypothetical protein